MVSFFEIFHPSFLLFPALLGSAVLGLVSPVVGAHLILRRRVFLGLALPQVAACGVAFTFWLYHEIALSHVAPGERLLAMFGSLLFTLGGMGLLAYLDRHATGTAEGRLATAYALASALTILFVVFNPTGELEILNLLKGEVIALSKGELKLLSVVYGLVLVAFILFRREFLLTSFDRDLAFLFTGGNVRWSVLLYLLSGIAIAVGVIMAGPLLVFGFMVLPPMAARSLAKSTRAFFSLSCLLGLLTAVLGFYLSVRLDLPLGPTDVAVGCLVVFVSHAASRIRGRSRIASATVVLSLAAGGFLSSCSTPSAPPLSKVPILKDSPVWIAPAKNSTGLALRLPSTNPLRSLGEMAGKISPDKRQTVMDLLREAMQAELERREIKIFLPEAMDDLLRSFPSDIRSAAKGARAGGLSGLLLLSDIRRWDAEPRKLGSVLVDFKLVRISDGAPVWERRIRHAIDLSSAAHLGQAYSDMIGEVVREIFEP